MKSLLLWKLLGDNPILGKQEKVGTPENPEFWSIGNWNVLQIPIHVTSRILCWNLKWCSFLTRKITQPLFTFSAPCREYTSLTDSWRKVNGFGPSSIRSKKYRCDFPRPTQGEPGIQEGWHRFSGAAGTHLPTASLNNGAGGKEVCGTSIVGWMEGSHPTVYDGIVSRNICFEFENGNCEYQVRILVRTCDDPAEPGKTFYVYHLKYPKDIMCYWAYCAMD